MLTRVRDEVNKMLKDLEPCCLCNGPQHQVDVYATFNIGRPGKRIFVMPLCERCAADPNLKIRKAEFDFVESVTA